MAVMMCNGQDQEEENSTCFKTVLKKESKSRYELSTKGTGWWFVNKLNRTKIRLRTQQVPVQVNVCCQGYVNISGICTKAQCPHNKFGELCAEDCPCIQGNYERCDVNGTCLCYSGWTGEDCSQNEKDDITNNGQFTGLLFGSSLGGALLISLGIIGGCVLFKYNRKQTTLPRETGYQNGDYVDLSFQMNEHRYEHALVLGRTMEGRENMETSDLIYANCDN